MAKFFSTLLILMITPLILFGQKGYLNGYVITTDGDTLKGIIKDRKEYPYSKLYTKIKFKGNKPGARRYKANQIDGYLRGGDQFESIWVSDSENTFFKSYESVTGSGSKRFAKIIVKGYLSYYQLEQVDGDTGNLDFTGYYKRKNEAKMQRVSQGIFGLKRKKLIHYFADCPSLVDKIKNKEFSSPIEIAGFYNEWIANN